MTLRTQRLLLLITFILVPLVNYLPVVLGWGRGRFEEDADTYVDAAGYAFSIWGVIFLGMLAFSYFQLKNEEPVTPALRRAYNFLISAGLASIAFVPISVGSNEVLGWLNILWHLVSLIGAHLALRRHVVGVGRPFKAWTYFAPTLYLGWISAATVIATALALEQLGLRPTPALARIVAALLVTVLFGLGTYLTVNADAFYGLTVAWALVAVGVEQWPVGIISYPAFAGAVALVVLAVMRKLRFYATT